MTPQQYNQSVDEWSDPLYRFALSMVRDSEYAKDLVQECYTRLWEKKQEVDHIKVKSYLFTTIHRLVIDQSRKVNSQRSWETQQSLTAADHRQYSDLQEVLHTAMEQLTEIQKSVLLLRDYEGYSYDEIAELTNLSASQVKVYIFRARQFMKAYIGKMEVVI
jgi:RNA polymerase sigma factor (sigma-70 family)